MRVYAKPQPSWDPFLGYDELTHLIERHAVDFIDRQKEQPFFLYLAFTTPHSPYTEPGESPM